MSYAVLDPDQIPADGVGVVQLDDRELMVRFMESILGKQRPLGGLVSEVFRPMALELATVACDYLEERCEAAKVRYA